MKSRILIVDDHPIFRMGMAELLNQEMDFNVLSSSVLLFISILQRIPLPRKPAKLLSEIVSKKIEINSFIFIPY